MLDVHPPHQSAHSWSDFLIHIATICVGLLIAIGLEQTVEALHHHHQREYLEEQMRTESERNLDLIHVQIKFASDRELYFDECLHALLSATPTGPNLSVNMPLNHVVLPTGMLISPSQGTWTVARAAGTVALLPAEEAKVYARLNVAADFEQASESILSADANRLTSTRLRDHIPDGLTAPVVLAVAQRDDAVFAFSESREDAADLKFRLAVYEGALDAVLAHVRNLEEVYPYQHSAILRENALGLSDRARNAAPPAK